MSPRGVETVPFRDVSNRLLRHRPDLGLHRIQRKRARDVGELVGSGAAAIDVLAAWLGNHPDADVRDLEGTLSDRVQLALARLPPKDRRDAEGPEFRGRAAMHLGWESLPSAEGRDVLRSLAIVGGGPVPRGILARACSTPEVTIEAVVAAGLVTEDEDGVRLPGPVHDFVEVQPDPVTRQERVARFLEAVRDALGDGDPRDMQLDAAADAAIELAQREHQGAVVASIAHRMCDRLRRRGTPGEAWAWAERGLRGRGTTTALGRPLFALLEVDLGLVALEQEAAGRAQEHLTRAVLELEGGAARGIEGAAALLKTARVALAQARLAAGEEPRRAEADLLLVLADWVSEGTGSEHRAGRAAIRISLGLRRLAEGRLPEAAALLAQASIDLGGVPNESGAVGLLVGQAQLARAGGRQPAAAELLERARVLAGGDLDRPAATMLPIVLHELGVLAADRGDRGGAATLLDEAAMLSGSLLPPTHPLRGLVARTRAVLFVAEGEPRRAALAAMRAREALERALPSDHIERGLTDVVDAWARLEEGSAHWDEVRGTLDAVQPRATLLFGPSAPAVESLAELRQTVTAAD